MDLSVAKEWFEQQYLSKFNNLRVGGDKEKQYKRKTDWSQAKKTIKKNKEECLLIPISYEGKEEPMFLAFTKENEFKKKLPKLFGNPITECLIVYKNKGKHEAFLLQIAYDRFNINKKDGWLDLNKLNGYIFTSDWDDNIQNFVFYENGVSTKRYLPADNSKARVNDYSLINTSYQTWHLDGAGDLVIVLHVNYTWHCIDNGGSGPGGGNYYPPNYPRDYFTNGGGGYYNPTWETVRSYNLDQAIFNPWGPDRQVFNSQLNDVTTALSMGMTALDLNVGTADAYVRAVGGIKNGDKTICRRCWIYRLYTRCV